MRIEFTHSDGLVVARVADHDVAEPGLQVLEVGGKAEDRHDFRRGGDLETMTDELLGPLPIDYAVFDRWWQIERYAGSIKISQL
mgnify:CR=1 FL=1